MATMLEQVRDSAMEGSALRGLDVSVGEEVSLVGREGGRGRGGLGSWSGWEGIHTQVGAVGAHSFPETGNLQGVGELGVDAVSAETPFSEPVIFS